MGLCWRVVASASHSRRPKDSNLRSYCAVLLRRPRRREAGWVAVAPVSSTVPSAFPKGKVGRLPAAIPLETTSCGGTFEVADISLCSGLQVCSPPRSSLPLRILPQGSRGFYVRAERGSLPPRASDMLTARIGRG